MKNEESSLVIISTGNRDNLSTISTQSKNGSAREDYEEPVKKKIHLDPDSTNDDNVSENVQDVSAIVSLQPSADHIQISTILSEFRDPVLFDRLKGTIKLQLQSSLAQSVKGLLSAVNTSTEEGNQLAKFNNDLRRRIKLVETITQKVADLVPERVPSSSQNRLLVVQSPADSTTLNTVSEAASSNTVTIQPTPLAIPGQVITEVAPLPEVRRSNIQFESSVLAVQPQLRIHFQESTGEGLMLIIEMEPVNYAFEPATSYELFSYASSDINPQLGLSSDLWQRVGSVEAMPLPMVCKLDYLQPGNIYYFAVFSVDKYDRASEWSNVVSIPVLLSTDVISLQPQSST